MRNTLLAGDLITAREKEMVVVDLPEVQADIVSQTNSADRRVKKFPAVPNVPLVQCFPFKQGNRYSCLLFPRRLDRPTPVTLQLPYRPACDVQIYTLATNAPGAHNIDEEVVRVQTTSRLDFSQTYAVPLPPYSIMVLVNHVTP